MSRNVLSWLYALPLGSFWLLDWLGVWEPAHTEFELFVGWSLLFITLVTIQIANAVFGED